MTTPPPFRGLGGPPAAAGTVHLVGGGPGDPGYLTLRAATVLATCDVVAYDHLSPAEALDLVPAHADRILVGRRAGGPGYARDEIDHLLLARAAAGAAVVRLKGGDPFVFGRGGEEALACAAAGIPYEVVPGVTSPVAVPGAAGIPVTHRGVAAGFAVVTGHSAADDPLPDADHAALARFPGTLLCLMGLRRVRSFSDALVRHGRDPDTPAAVVAHGTLPTQRSVRATLATLADAVERAGLEAPAIIVVGDVTAVLADLPGRERRPLHGRRILLPYVPAGRAVTDDLAGHLRAAGAAVVALAVASEVPADPATLGRLAVALREGEVGTLVVATPASLAPLLAVLPDVGTDVRALAGVALWAAGEDVAATLIQRHGLTPDEVVDRGGRPVTAGGEVVVLAPDGADGGLAGRLGGRCVASSLTRPLGDLERPTVDAIVVPDVATAAHLVAAGLPDVPVVAASPAAAQVLTDAGVAAAAGGPTPADLITALARSGAGVAAPTR